MLAAITLGTEVDGITYGESTETDAFSRWETCFHRWWDGFGMYGIGTGLHRVEERNKS